MVACLAFTDASTKDVYVPDSIFASLKKELGVLAAKENEEVEVLLVEMAGVVATYNMVSRFLVSLDVAGKMERHVPLVLEEVTEVRPSTLYIHPLISVHSIRSQSHPPPSPSTLSSTYHRIPITAS